jgi:hypothetical protein
MDKEGKPFYYGTTFHALMLVAIGIVITVFGELGISSLEDAFPRQKPVFELAKSVVQGISAMIVIIGVVVLSLKRVLVLAWENYLSKPLKEFLKNNEIILSNISSKILDISNHMNEYIRKRGGPLTLAECTNTEDFQRYVNQAFSNIFGHHTLHPKSFLSFVRNHLITPFCCEPHQSRVFKRISIREYPPNQEYIFWDEETSYRIHHLDPNKSGVFDVTYSTSSYAPGMAVEDWQAALKFRLRVDNEPFILPACKFVENSTDEGLFIWKIDDWVFLRYKYRLILEKEFTEISFDEESINARADRSYAMNASAPIFGLIIDFELPPNCAFRKDKYLSPQTAYKGLPNFAKTKIKQNELFEMYQNGENHLNIKIKEWILPGIIFKADWFEKA